MKKDEGEEDQLVPPDYIGPSLGSNVFWLSRKTREVHKVALGEKHIIVHCTEAGSGPVSIMNIALGKNTQPQEMLYGLGDNRWGQLGFDPILNREIKKLTPISIEVLREF